MRLVVGLMAAMYVLVFTGSALAQEQDPNQGDTNGSVVLEELRNKQESLGPYYSESTMILYDEHSPNGREFSTTKVWKDGSYSRLERIGYRGKTSLVIHHPDATYVYDAEQDTYTVHKPVVPPPGATVGTLSFGPAKLVGSEMVDGKLVTVLEEEVPPIIPGISSSVKTWYWTDTGLPLRVEQIAEAAGVSSKRVEEYGSYSFDKIPRSMFEVSEEKIRR